MDRDFCQDCFRTKPLCLCKLIEVFEIEPLIVFLVHPREFMKTIGTVRMAKLSLKGSILLRGHGKDFDQDVKVSELTENPNHHAVILFPGQDSLNLTLASEEAISTQLPSEKRLIIFVIDGSWSAAKNMIRDSQKLRSLPKLSFDVNQNSIYQIRKQPLANCLSTIEAVSTLVENLRTRGLCRPKPEEGHHKMIRVFRKMISDQLQFESNPKHRAGKRYGRGKQLQSQ